MPKNSPKKPISKKAQKALPTIEESANEESVNPLLIEEALKKTSEFKRPEKLVLDELKELLSLYASDECEIIINFLHQRIHNLTNTIGPETHIDDLHLSFRPHGLLGRNKLFTVRDILAFGLDNLSMLDGAGPQSVNEIKQALKQK